MYIEGFFCSHLSLLLKGFFCFVVIYWNKNVISVCISMYWTENLTQIYRFVVSYLYVKSCLEVFSGKW